MPALYPNYRCEVCGNSHALYYPGIGAVPDLSKPHYYTCSALPVTMRITRGDRWKPVKEKPEGAIEVHTFEGWEFITRFAPSAQP
jgi:hypothetical protein